VTNKSDFAAAEASGMAGRYAVALFELARDNGQLDAVAGELSRIIEMLEGSPELSALAASPIIRRDAQAKAMEAVLERAGMSELTRKFVGLVASKRRLFAFRNIVRAYKAILAHHRGQIAADVTAARSLDDGQVATLKAALKGALGHDVCSRI
jgi:F-type H+-transporting ATPase subunit delta